MINLQDKILQKTECMIYFHIMFPFFVMFFFDISVNPPKLNCGLHLVNVISESADSKRLVTQGACRCFAASGTGLGQECHPEDRSPKTLHNRYRAVLLCESL